MSTLMSLATHEPPPPAQLNPSIPRALSDLVMRLLAKSRDGRPASARDVLRELELIAAGGSAGEEEKFTMKSRPRATPRRSHPRRPLALAAIGAGCLAALALATIFFLRTPAGTIKVTIDDPEVEVAIKGTDLKFSGADVQPVSLKPGEKTLVVTRGDFTFETKNLVIKKGQTTVVRVELLPGALRVFADGRPLADRPLPPPGARGNRWPEDRGPPPAGPGEHRPPPGGPGDEGPPPSAPGEHRPPPGAPGFDGPPDDPEHRGPPPRGPGGHRPPPRRPGDLGPPPGPPDELRPPPGASERNSAPPDDVNEDGRAAGTGDEAGQPESTDAR